VSDYIRPLNPISFHQLVTDNMNGSLIFGDFRESVFGNPRRLPLLLVSNRLKLKKHGVAVVLEGLTEAFILSINFDSLTNQRDHIVQTKFVCFVHTLHACMW